MEREVAKTFDKWLYESKGVLTRTPLSGGWNNSKLGDVCADPTKLQELGLPIPKIYIEAKNREGLLSEKFFNWLSCGTPSYMNELIKDTIKKAGFNYWFIILKGNGVEPWVFTNVRCDKTSWHLQFTFEGQVVYYMFPLKMVDTVYLYCDVKENIKLGKATLV